MCDQCQCREDADRAMWLGIARALVQVTRGITGIANAIQKRYAGKPETTPERRVA